MNDFTKCDLIELRACVRECSEKSGTLKGYYDAILIKLQKTIENYCEHDWTESYREEEYSICRKCGVKEL